MYIPKSLVEFLELDTKVQQDVQEFSKLILQRVDEQCPEFNSTSLVSARTYGFYRIHIG
jgi:hypothetical protein